MANVPPVELPPNAVGFLLSTLGFHSHAVWAERLLPLGLDSRQAAMIRHVAGAEGQPQQALAQALGIPPSRVVGLVDALEQRGLLRRQGDPADRRVRTLHLTSEGRRMVRTLAEVSAAHEHSLCVGLKGEERQHLLLLLKKVVAGLDLSDTVHSGLAGGDWRQP
jgi:DNA-binding MarR family transcriptional regulator